MITQESLPNADTVERRLSEANRIMRLYNAGNLDQGRASAAERLQDATLPPQLAQAIEQHGPVEEMTIGSQPRALRKGFRMADGLVVEYQRHVEPGFSEIGDWELVRVSPGRRR